MKRSLNNILVLVCICAVVSVILAITNALTAPAILANEKAKVKKALLQVMPDGVSFEQIDISTTKLPSTVEEAYRAENGGYVIKLKTTGYASGMVIMCGVSADGKVVGTKMIASGETPSIGGVAADTISKALIGKNADNVVEVDTIGGATKTTAAYRNAVKDALNAALALQGIDVEVRTEEEILRDNLNAALPSAGGEFEPYFIAEKLTNVSRVYQAKNKSGFVCVIGEQFVGLNAVGEALSESSDETAEIAETAMRTLFASETRDLTLTSYEGLSSRLVSAKKTATGNYVLEINGAGYGINGTRNPSGKYILIRVSLTSDGTIIDCMTVSQDETDGIGAACAEESFYGQFDGKTEENYDEIDAISGASLTTDGYKQAILVAFESVKIFERGAAA